MKKILFVCTGNSCRSPMAAAYFRYLSERAKIEVKVDSAGVSAMDGAPISSAAVQGLAREGIGPLREVSKAITADQVEWADLIVVMSSRHQDWLRYEFPQARDKIRHLLSYAGSSIDVFDPLGGTVQDYSACLEEMKPALLNLLQEVKMQS